MAQVEVNGRLELVSGQARNSQHALAVVSTPEGWMKGGTLNEPGALCFSGGVALFLLASASCHDRGAEGRQAAASESPATQGTTDSGTSGEEVITYFFSRGCPDCEALEATLMRHLEEQGVRVQRMDVDTPEGFAAIERMEQEQQVELTVLAPVVLHRGRVLRGPAEIRQKLQAAFPD